LKLPTFIKAGCPYLKPHGLMIAMLGSGWADEIDRAIGHIKRAGLNIVKIHEYILPVSQSQRALVIFEKK
jgi:16S rRNA G527 N7-methylase RsmG